MIRLTRADDGKIYVQGFDSRDVIHSFCRAFLKRHECPLCRGKGFVDEMPGLDCGKCSGTGYVDLPSEFEFVRLA